ncbi:MAG: glycoside hydrolase family 13 protein [Oscillospiraceae bacterium]|nr:glycoside hydrolase family 13 protein [Oscillospiraceae bacterium]
MSHLYDSWDLNYKTPFGAVRRGKIVYFNIRLPKELKPDFPPCIVIYRPGYKERFMHLHIIDKEEDCNVWGTGYIPKFTGVHYYYFSYTTNGQRFYIKKTAGHIGNINDGDMFQLTVYSEDYKTPDFLKGGIMYQIFPDRFYKSGKVHENIPEGRVLREDWGGTPYYRPDQNGHVWNNDYFGGDLAGVQEKLPYLHDLGVTCIYLNPIFESHENHRYNTANYRKVDPLLGTNEDFQELCKEASKLGISVILDGVFSHTGADSIYFNRYNRYDNLGAYQSKDSEYYDWYTFWNFPNEYEAWWGFETLPNVRENNKSYTNYICGKDGVLNYWLSLGAAGFRLDVADELPDEFLDNLRTAVKKNNPQKIVIGEVWEDASNKEAYGVKRRYLLGSQLDSVMNYPFRDAIINYIKGMSSRDFQNCIMTILENYPKDTIDVLMNFVSTHDIERAINRFGGESCDDKSKDWMAERYLNEWEYRRGKAMLQAAMAIMYFLPGVPSIYYGDEAGLQGYKDPFNRRCYPWGHEDQELIAYTKELSRIRLAYKVFRNGKMQFLPAQDDVMAFARIQETAGISVQIYVNRSQHEQHVEFKPCSENFVFDQVERGVLEENFVKLQPFDYAVIVCRNPEKIRSEVK